MRLSLQQLFWRFSILDYWCYIGTLKIVYDETFTVVAGCKRWRNWSSSFSPHWFGCWKLLCVWLCCIVIVFKIFASFSQFLSVLCKFHVLFHVFQHMIWSLLNATYQSDDVSKSKICNDISMIGDTFRCHSETVETHIKELVFVRTFRLRCHRLKPLNKNPKEAEMGMFLIYWILCFWFKNSWVEMFIDCLHFSSCTKYDKIIIQDFWL